jgi:hypothetical protein
MASLFLPEFINCREISFGLFSAKKGFSGAKR